MAQDPVPAILNPEVQEANNNRDPAVPPKYSLETLAFLVCKSRVGALEASVRSELKALKERQANVRYLHQFMKAVNQATDGNGALDLSDTEGLDDMLQKLQDLGIETDPNKMNYSKEEKERLVDNIRMTIEDLNIENDMQLQTISRLTNERYESFQLARSIMKPLHDDKLNKARAISGR